MLNSDDLADLRSRLEVDPDLTALFATLRARAARLVHGELPIPAVKALLSQDGGCCPTDGATLIFDPWSPHSHRCPRCQGVFSGDRHHRNWARAQHLWLAERAAELALIGALAEDQRAISQANTLIRRYAALYLELPNSDNVLGPSHLFFSTYLESVWICSWLSAAYILREAELLEPGLEAAVDQVADEAANIIAEFNEGLSNRQTWHAAALTSVAAWFGDVELAREMVESRTGLLGHLAEGFGDDGLWYEGENYHLFAIRGLMYGTQWAKALGFDLLDNPGVRKHFRSALLAPSRSALPDFTYPARRDARYGVSLAQPSSMDLWEVGSVWLDDDPEIGAWLQALYQLPLPLPPAEHQDYWLHDAGLEVSPSGRADLSWWALLAIRARSDAYPPWQPASTLLKSQGLAVLRLGQQYVSLECGPAVGGHGHPDRLHLTLHANGCHWLPDMGTGSYVSPTLAWYRSAMAHNAPMLDGDNVGGQGARCAAFDARENVAWCVGVAGDVTRTVVAIDDLILDIVELSADDTHTLLLPFHVAGSLAAEEEADWKPLESHDPWLRDVVTQTGLHEPFPTLRATDSRAGCCTVVFSAPESTLHAGMAPWLPTTGGMQRCYWLEGKGKALLWTTIISLDSTGTPPRVTAMVRSGATVTLQFEGGKEVTYRFLPTGVEVRQGDRVTNLGGVFPQGRPVIAQSPAPQTLVGGIAEWVDTAPALDGTFDGFALGSPMRLDRKSQYRRSEAEYDPTRVAARAWLNWDGTSLYLAARVKKLHRLFRPSDAPPLLLDNEPDDIHSDGLQIYWRTQPPGGGSDVGFLVIPNPDGTVRVRSLAGIGTEKSNVSGHWQPTEDGYLVTLRLDDPGFPLLTEGETLSFDLLINEMQPDRMRRAGQLVWGGDGGWVYLIGDRHTRDRMGVITLTREGRG